MKKKRHSKKKALILWALLALLLGYLIWENTGFVVTKYTFASDQVPESLNGMKIALVSDLHNKEYGEENADLTSAIVAEDPDIIVITGDLIGKDDTDLTPAVNFAKECVKIAPTYYVTGNHEQRSELRRELINELRKWRVTILEDATADVSYGEEGRLSLWGLSTDTQLAQQEDDGAIPFTLNTLRLEGNAPFRILLAHEPTFFSAYAKSGVELVLSGHTHGGQICLPLIGAIYTPDQGLFPKYQSGLYQEGHSTMIVSRGLGNSIIPFRTFSRYELVIVTLMAEE